MEDIIYSINGRVLKAVTVNALRYDVAIKEGTRIIKKEAFQNVYFQSITFPKSLKKIEKYAFNSSALKELIIEKSVEIEEEAFINNLQLKKVDINCDVIPAWCFYDCSKPNMSEVVGMNIKLNNTSVLKECAFSYCHINNLNIPNLKYIYPRAFEGSTFNNTILHLPDTLLIIGSNVFRGTNITDIYLPESIRMICGLQNEKLHLHMSKNTFNRLNLEKSDNIFIIPQEELYKDKTFKEINRIYKEASKKDPILDSIDFRELKKFL